MSRGVTAARSCAIRGVVEDLYIASDLHLGEGFDSVTRRWARLESFFYDEEFGEFLVVIAERARENGRAVRLVLNGDVFDFLAVRRLPTAEEIRREGFRLSAAEHRLGLLPGPRRSAWKLEVIVRGHRRFFVALLRFVSSGGRVTIVRGNHDNELVWEAVKDRLYALLAEFAAEESLGLDEAALRKTIAIEDWFYYEPGRIWVEHGHQYDRANSLHCNLYPVVPAALSGADEDVLDLPAGSYFVRYVINRARWIDPFTPFIVSWDRYFTLLGRGSFPDIVRILLLHIPFMLRSLRQVHVFELHGMKQARSEHHARMAALAERSGIDKNILERIDALREEPVGRTKYALAQQLLRPLVHTALLGTGLGLAAVLVWFFLFTLVQASGLVGSVVLKASLLAFLAVVAAGGLAFVLVRIHRRLTLMPDPFASRYSAKAETIAQIAGVRFVSMGHTHGADYRVLATGRDQSCGAYANSGTWIPVPSRWDPVINRARQFTFVHVRGMDHFELLRWDPERRRAAPAPLLEPYTPSPLERLLTEEDVDA